MKAETTTEIRSLLRASRKFRQWKPARTKSVGLGTDLSYTGKIYKNCAKPNEKHYTVADVASLWGISEDLVRDIFRDESSVLRISRPATKMKRAYSTLRIPESTLNRVYSDLSNEEPNPNAEPLAASHKKVPTP